MNRFRTKKKVKENAELDRRVSNDEVPKTAPALKTSKTFRLGKKAAPEPEQKLELDLTSALPSSDDFRTSLLMSGLSARFSMLREQDDPSSKIGKASDDSVLFPKRQSRLVDFGFMSNGLSDIAEVSSIHSSVRPRPPFAMSRTESYHSADGYGTDDDSTYAGSVMARAKPAHGNNLFGGRQKIFKIPVGGNAALRSPTGNPETGSMGGRALYDDDVSMSAFQKLREREKQQRREQEEHDREEPSQSPPRRSNSPPLTGYNRNRETSSTTASGPSLTRSSTAATSVTSQRTPSLNGHSNPSTPVVPGQSNNAGLERIGTKTRRLYENGLDQHLHSQQYSAMSRLDSLSRQRNFGARTPSPSIPSPTNNTFNIPEAPEQEGSTAKKSIDSSSDDRLGSFEFGVKRSEILDVPKSVYASPPLSPPMSEGDEQSLLPIQPNDRGKATAAGVFAKPAQPYDESKYAQRQLQMQGGRATPPLHAPPRPAAQQLARNRAESNSTYSSSRSRSSSSVQGQWVPPQRTFVPQQASKEISTPETEVPTSGTFLSSPNDSSTTASPNPDIDDARSNDRPPVLQLANGNILPPISIQKPPESDHPANRERSNRLWLDFTDEPEDQLSSKFEAAVSGRGASGDSPTISGLGAGLSGMVRQHLRSDSNSSSVYGAPSPALNSRFTVNESREDVSTIKGNPWDVNDWDIDYTVPPKFGAKPSPASPGSKSGSLAKEESVEDAEKSPIDIDRNPQHNREGSSATQKERDDFKNELAFRRKRVQENLRSFAESDSRSVSPAAPVNRSRDTSVTRGSPGMGMLRQTPSRTSLVGWPKEGGQSKAMRMLGIGAATYSSNGYSSNAEAYDENAWKRDEESTTHGVSNSPVRMPPDPKAIRQARRDAQRNRERDTQMRHQQRPFDEPDRDMPGQHPQFRQREPSREGRGMGKSTYGRSPSRQGRMPPMKPQRMPSEEASNSPESQSQSSSRPPSRTVRDRSSSDVSGGRSKSRNGRYRDDLAKAMAEGTGSSAQGSFEDIAASRIPARSPAFPDSAGPSPSVENRARSNSKTNGGYFDNQQLRPIQTNNIPDFSSPRPSPITPYSVNSTPALNQPAQSVSNVGTPTGQGFQIEGRVQAARKRSVNKSDISEPTFVSSTARMPTVHLNEAAPLQNINITTAPPVPDFNPRRRQTKTQTMFGVFGGKSADNLSNVSMPNQPYQEFSAFDDEESSKPRVRQKLRKSSSEGGNLNARARAAFIAAPSPALPGQFPLSAGIPPQHSQSSYGDNMF